jgi:hypothetical protein
MVVSKTGWWKNERTQQRINTMNAMVSSKEVD